MSVQDFVPFAQIATAFVAAGALGVATWSLAAQKAVARRRAAIDFFLKTEMDEKMLIAYNAYVGGKSQIAQSSDMRAFCSTPHYEHVRSYLNVLELMAVGVEQNTFDEGICYAYWQDFIKGAVADCRPMLEYLRTLPAGNLSYGALLKLDARWSAATRFWQRWRGARA